ncbi:MAG TPA: UDP-N-acetyl-alpha-D-muramoyl-L-alanyl-L-glutamate epimerase [Xylella sp.]
MATFDPSQVSVFRFVRCALDAQTGVVSLVYAFDQGPEFVERIMVPGAPFALKGGRAEAVRQALRLLHLMAGVSYYKACVPATVVIEDDVIDAETAALVEHVYLYGLSEFAYRNGLNLQGRFQWPVQATVPRLPAPEVGLREHALVALGGGKDSLVSIETLRLVGVHQTVVWVGNSPLIRACADRTGLPVLNIGRRLAPELFELNHQGAWNGHVPVTAINSAILVLVALLHGVNQVVFSNERSASYGSVIPGTGEVNHQWSKGWAFEQHFSDYVQRRVAADMRYYSLLRPLSELAVARQFARSVRYDAYFSSCNRNFHILGERPVHRWCGQCPKCHFVFLALALFMPKTRLVGIFGRNLLDDSSQASGFDALLEWLDYKPFECVGEARESRTALAVLAQRAEWKEDAVVMRFIREIQPHLDPAGLHFDPLLALSDEHRIPACLWERVSAHFRA